MFNATEILVDAFVAELKQSYNRMFGGYKRDYAEILAWSARMALENIANSDALYHDAEHTMLVTLVGQEILTGKHMCEGGVSCEDWLHVTISLLCHDIGYVRGVCRGDRRDKNEFVTGEGDYVSLKPGASDAALAPYHVARGRQFVAERFGGHPVIDSALIERNIEYTRFPMPLESDGHDDGYADLVRAADLIGQLGDLRYLQKLHALFYELEEIGANARLGFRDTGELRDRYPAFFWGTVNPFLTDAMRYLEVTQRGKQFKATLYANVFRQENAERVGALPGQQQV